MPRIPAFHAPALPALDALSSLVGGSVNPGGSAFFLIFSHADDSSALPVHEQRAFFIHVFCVRPGLGVPGLVVRDPFVSARLRLPLIEVVEDGSSPNYL